MEIPTFALVGAGIVAVIVQAAKEAGLPSRFAGLASLATVSGLACSISRVARWMACPMFVLRSRMSFQWLPPGTWTRW
jgi:preprotein translocase subunit SecG